MSFILLASDTTTSGLLSLPRGRSRADGCFFACGLAYMGCVLLTIDSVVPGLFSSLRRLPQSVFASSSYGSACTSFFLPPVNFQIPGSFVLLRNFAYIDSSALAVTITRLGPMSSLHGLASSGRATFVSGCASVGLILLITGCATAGSLLSSHTVPYSGYAFFMFGCSRMGSSPFVFDLVSSVALPSLQALVCPRSRASAFGFTRLGLHILVLNRIHLGFSLPLQSRVQLGPSTLVLNHTVFGSSLLLQRCAHLSSAIETSALRVLRQETNKAASFEWATNNRVDIRVSDGHGHDHRVMSFIEGTTSGGVLHGLWSSQESITTSDRRLKQNITDLRDHLDKRLPIVRKVGAESATSNLASNETVPLDRSSWVLRQLRPVSFSFSTGGNGTRFGFIAQELEEVLPETVRTQASESVPDQKGVLYQDLIALLTAGAQSQQLHMEEQQRRTVIVENALEQMQRTLEQLMQNAQERAGLVLPSGGVAEEQQRRIATLENSLEKMQRTQEQLMQKIQERTWPVPSPGGAADDQQRRIVTLENSLEQMQRTLQKLVQNAQERARPVPPSGGTAEEQQRRIVTLENSLEKIQRTLEQLMQGAQQRARPAFLSGGTAGEQQRHKVTPENSVEQMQRTLRQSVEGAQKPGRPAPFSGGLAEQQQRRMVTLENALEKIQRTLQQSMQGVQELERPVPFSGGLSVDQQHRMFILENSVTQMQRALEQSMQLTQDQMKPLIPSRGLAEEQQQRMFSLEKAVERLEKIAELLTRGAQENERRIIS